ncbi:MAG: hypothetical protein KKA64_04405 [Nanoarchaeota archaeon]|nr:hypothetical protein [Nanoarchaeota archaeon]
MPIHFRSTLTLRYKELIKDKFNFLINFFDFEPGDLFIEILPLQDFENYCKLENCNLSDFGVGSAISNGRVLVLDQKDFPKKDHKEEEFERVILHELCHMFIRRIINPKQTYPWIEEGICEYISFGDYSLKIKEIVTFSEIKTIDNWRKHYAYQQSKEFFKRLSEKFGNNKIVDFVKKIKEKSEEESFKEVFGKELNEFEKEFITSLENEKVTQSRNTL